MPLALPFLVLLFGGSSASRFANEGDKGGSLEPIQKHEGPNDRVPTNNGPEPLVAVCIVGLVRSFVDPVVYMNLKDNFLDKVSNKTFAFAVLKDYSDPLLSHENQHSHGLQKALDYIKPIRSTVYTTEEEDFVLDNYTCHYDYESIPQNLTGVRVEWKKDMDRQGHPIYKRSLGQMKGAWDCVQQIKEVEKKHQVKFDGVFRIRTDNVWVRPPIPAKELLRLSKKKNAILHDWDMVLFVPREGMHYFSRFYDDWLKCKGSWPGPSVPELEWEDGAKALGYRYQNFPFPQIIKRPDICSGNPMQHCYFNSANMKFAACVRLLYSDEISNGLNIEKAEKYQKMLNRCGMPGYLIASPESAPKGCPTKKEEFLNLIQGYLPTKCFASEMKMTLIADEVESSLLWARKYALLYDVSQGLHAVRA